MREKKKTWDDDERFYSWLMDAGYVEPGEGGALLLSPGLYIYMYEAWLEGHSVGFGAGVADVRNYCNDLM